MSVIQEPGMPAATTPVQTRSFSDPAGYGARLLTFDQFDPALGTLVGVHATGTANVAGSGHVESLELRAATIGYQVFGHITVFEPGGRLLAEGRPYEMFGGTSLAGPGGGADFAGDSGTAATGFGGLGFSGSLMAGEIDAAAFTGTGTVALAVGDVVRSSIEGPANMRVRAEAASMRGEVSLAYQYVPVGGWGGAGGVVTTITPLPGIPGPRPLTATTAVQIFHLAAQNTGWQDRIEVVPFDPALGALAAVQVRLGVTTAATARIENHTEAAGRAAFLQQATTTLALGGTEVAVARALVNRWLEFGVPDGSDDFAGSGGAQDGSVEATKTVAATLAQPATLALFSAGAAVELTIESVGYGNVYGPASFVAEMAARSGAVVEVAYTYVVDAALSGMLVAGAGMRAGEAYAGGVQELQHQFIQVTPENLNIAATSDNWFIHTGSGTDAIAARGGRNVIDGGGGSNFLSGGFGHDTFFVDIRGASGDVWSTVVDFGHGDEATVWGVTQANFSLLWLDDEGAAGATGLTLHASSGTGPMASLTLAGYGTADLTNGSLSVSFGSSEGSPYMYVRAA